MTQVKYVSVVDIEGHGGQIRPGKVDKSGGELAIPTAENDRDEFSRREWERVEVFQLDEPMPKSEFKEWWNERVHEDDRPELIDDIIEVIDEIDEGQEAAA